ncbi:SAV_2336 N-terminal domain-related protein [Streptomyces sp. NPDC096310]|uniref:SAV_2336 N-terminal domain-related protein n=1 Tax=Streptomyces sp. NPDC096310 TaxID=3366082 RepID=UPI0037F3D114
MWQPLARDLFMAFGQTGAFRTVELVRLGADGTVPPRQWTAGRTLALVISDAMGPQWREGPAGQRWYDTLRGWARRLPVAVLQPLPERMWQQTALAPVPGLFTAPGPGAPNTALRFAPYDGPASRGIPVPVLEPTAGWLTQWAGLVASPGGASFPGAAALLPAGRSHAVPETWESGAADALVPEAVPADELVLRFRAAASPQAVRLAGHLAVGPAHLPVMRLVQAAVEEHPRPQHLAEVVLSGMLRSVPGPPGSYDFRPGVREVLLHSLPRTSLARTVGLLDRVGAEIESRAGSARGVFRALLGGGAGGEPFALVSPESVRLLRGPEPDEVPVAPPPDPANEVVAGRYELLEVIGRGERSVVWRARDRRDTPRMVALKWVDRTGPENEEVQTQRLRELRFLTGVRHPGITAISDSGKDDDGTYLVMELLAGRSLRQRLEEPGGRPLPVADIADIARQLIDALAYAHRRGLVHRCLTPEKVIQLPDGTVKVLGFDPRPASRTTATGATTGTPQYMSPEQISGGVVDGRSDLYALGCILYELATGQPPFAGDSPVSTFFGHREQQPQPPGELRPGLPAALENAILDLLAKDPEERRRGAEALASEVLPVPEALPESTWQYGVLGPLRPLKDGWGHTPGTAAGRVVLSMLLLSEGDQVSFRELQLALGSTPNRQTNRMISAAIGELLASGHDIEESEGRFRLRLDTELDLTVAKRLARQAAQTQDRRHRAALYEEALSLWYGEPLGGVEGTWAEQQRDKIHAWRVALKAHRQVAAPPPPASGGAVHLTIGGAELNSVPPDSRSAAQAVFLSLLRQACREAFGSSGTFVDPDVRLSLPTMALRVAADPAYTVPEVLNRLMGPFAETLTAGMSSLFFPLTVPMTVLIDEGEPEEVARALERGFPAPVSVGDSKPGKISMMVGLPDEVYQRSGAPEGFVRRDMKRANSVTRPVWYLTVGYPPEKPRQGPSRLRRLFGGGRVADAEPDAAAPPPEEPR